MTEEADHEDTTATTNTNTAGYGTNGVAVAEVGGSWVTNVVWKHFCLIRRLGHQRRKRM